MSNTLGSAYNEVDVSTFHFKQVWLLQIIHMSHTNYEQYTESRLRVHLHLATATSLPNQFYCFGVVLLHPAFVTATAT